MKISQKGLALIKEFEGYKTKLHNGDCKAYLDTLAKPHIWTIGYGCTEGVTEGMIWTEKQAEAMLLKEIAKHEKAVSDRLKVKINQNQFDALVSLSYNIGPDAFPTLLRYVNNEDWKDAADSFTMYNKAGGKVYRGLTRRREAEKALFLTPSAKEIYDNSSKMKMSYWTRMTSAVLTLFGAISWNTLGEVKQFASDNAGIILLVVAGVAFIIFKTFENKIIKDHDEGRYIPSGMVDQEESK